MRTIGQGVTDLTDTASLTVQAAADATGISEDTLVIDGAAKMLDCWAYGDRLREWSNYRQPEILTEKIGIHLLTGFFPLLTGGPRPLAVLGAVEIISVRIV